jgi:alkylation response protein AidB-like acyl-CoA dehydrogenase
MMTQAERIEQVNNVAKHFKERARIHDENVTFPVENINELKDIGYFKLTIPKEYGGDGISLTEMLTHQETIAKYDGATALSVGWHMGIIMEIGENHVWDEDKYKAVVNEVINQGALVNNIASEPATGSPTRGGQPETIAHKTENGWVINGHKTFATLAPVLKYAIVSATLEGIDTIANFLIDTSLEGVEMDETWNSVAMRASGSHDFYFKDVHVNDSDLVAYRDGSERAPAGWMLHIPVCYLGIARAAQEAAVKFAKEYSPNSIKGTISELPNVQSKLGEIELRILEAERFLYSVSREWDENDKDHRMTMGSLLGAVKVSVVNKAIEAIDLAMRVVGAKSLSEDNELQRHYRNVRAGLHNPPMEDMVMISLAKTSIARMD